ncbi:MAG TPA: S1C family serine protease [Ilumatobacteraceae bacterium]
MRRRFALATIALTTALSSACGDDPDPPRARHAAFEVVATGCRELAISGEGLAVAPDRIVTVAHVVAGAESISVSGDAGTFDAHVVALDPALDLAVLAVDTDDALQFIELGTAERGSAGTVVVHRDGNAVALPVTVQRRVVVNTDDIHRSHLVQRPGYELATPGARIEQGDSGAVVVVDGRAVAVVWSRSNRDDTRAWATDATSISDGLVAAAPIDAGECPPPSG